MGKVVTAGFLDITEFEGQYISQEQLDRMCHRYHWAALDCVDRDVLEVACGAGQGLELLRRVSKSVVAGDYSPEVLNVARKTIADAIPLLVFDAEKIPFPNESLDRILIFEALYYVKCQASFFAEAYRVLRPGGKLLVTSANKDLYDFHPSPLATRYLGVTELRDEISESGFSVELWGYLDTGSVAWRQRLLRPAKAVASKLGLIPKTLRGREWLKRMFFGAMVTMPASLHDIKFQYNPPRYIDSNHPDSRHKVIYCCATKI